MKTPAIHGKALRGAARGPDRYLCIDRCDERPTMNSGAVESAP